MTNTAKPTPGPWYFCPYPAGNGGFVYAGGPGGPSICDMSQYELPEQNGEFIAEAGTVYQETNLTPRQMLEQRDALRRELDDTLLTLKSVKATLDFVEDRIKAALAKHGENV